jgi:SpoVK/Ycf46/Vps4 family AAA+-type ATPase
VRGLLLYGPPGNGKTRLAVVLSNLLGCTEENKRLKIMSGTEIFSKWVGESESNVRKIFHEAEAAQKKYGDASELYVVIIDEIDGMLAERNGEASRVNDKVVNEFLSRIDGPTPLNNSLVIATTNREDLIDRAAKRPGRFSVQIRINPPDEQGRLKIFEVHTNHLKKINRIDSGVDFTELAKRTEEFTGADVKGVVEFASSHSLQRLWKSKIPPEKVAASVEARITMDDFLLAIEDIRGKKGNRNAVPMMMYT